MTQGGERRAFKDLFELRIVITIQSASRDLLLLFDNFALNKLRMSLNDAVAVKIALLEEKAVLLRSKDVFS